MIKRISLPILVLSILLFSSCISTIDFQHEDSLFYMGQFDQVKASLVSKEGLIDNRQGQLIKFLDFGMVDHAARNYKDSNNALENAEVEMDRLFTQSITKNIGTFLVNDNVSEYPGEAWENIYCNIFKSLNYYFLGETDEAMVEVRRSIEKQEALVASYPKMEQAMNEKYISNDFSVPSDVSQDFVISALAQYLGMVFSYETRDQNTFNYSKRKLEDAFAIQPKLYDFPVPKYLSVLENAGKNVTLANCLVFTGRAPFKKEVRSTYDYIDENGNLQILNYSIPKAVQRPSSVAKIIVDLEGEGRKYSFSLVPLERIDNIAMDTMEVQTANDTVKALIRVVSKELVYKGIKSSAANATDEDSASSLNLIGDLIGIFNDVSESADVRCSHFFPSMAWVGIQEIEEGTYTATISYYDRFNKLLAKQEISKYKPSEGNANILEGFMPR